MNIKDYNEILMKFNIKLGVLRDGKLFAESKRIKFRMGKEKDRQPESRPPLYGEENNVSR